ncbi:MAG: glycosyltransferase family 25 protein [Fibrobacterota bacterium]
MVMPDSYVISLKESPQRRTSFFARAERAGLDVTWFEGISGPSVDIESLQEKNYLTQPFHLKMAGSLGCFLSHLFLWEQIARDSHAETALIFEDDALIPRSFRARFAKAVPLLPSDWDMAWLGWHKNNCAPVNSSWGTPRRGRGNTGHFAYLLRRSSVPKLKEILLPYDNTVSKDIVLRRNFAHFNAYFLNKRIVRTPFIEWGSIRKSLNRS